MFILLSFYVTIIIIIIIIEKTDTIHNILTNQIDTIHYSYHH